MTMTRPTTEQVTHKPSGAGSVSRLLVDKLSDAINVKDFGATGDGVTDDLPAFRNAIAAINAKGGGLLYVPAGTYGVDVLVTGSISGANLSKQIWLCKNLVMVMEPGTLIKALGTWAPGNSYIIFGANNGGTYPDAANITIIGNGAVVRGLHTTLSTDPGATIGFYTNNDIQNVKLYDLTFEDFGTCARFEVANSIVSGCSFLRGENNCVAVTRSSFLTFENCTFSDCIAGGTPGGGSIVEAGVDVEPNATDTCRDIMFRNCRFEGNYKYGLYAHQGGGDATYNITVDNCDFVDNGLHGVALVGSADYTPQVSDNVVQNSYFEGNGTLGSANAASLLVGSTSGTVIASNRIYTDDGPAYGLRATFNKRMVVSNNVFVGGGGSLNTAVVQLESDIGGSFDSNIVRGGGYSAIAPSRCLGTSISDNAFVNSPREIMRIRNNSSNMLVQGNLFANSNTTTGNEYVIVESGNAHSFIGNKFSSSEQYVTGTVTAYATSPAVTATLSQHSGNAIAYVGEYLRVGSEAIEITAYNASTGTVTLASAFSVAPTPGTSKYQITGPRNPTVGITLLSAVTGVSVSDNDFTASNVATPCFGGVAESIIADWAIDRSRSVTASYTASILDCVLLVDSTAGNVTVTLPSVTSNRVLSKVYVIKRMNAGANTITVAAASGQTIDGAASKSLASQYDTLRIIGTASEWSVI
jgi:hypothetical protein